MNIDKFRESTAGINFRCISCGDSERSKIKKRGWILDQKEVPIYYCHNCGENLALIKFLRRYHKDVYNRFLPDFISEKQNVIFKPTAALEVKQVSEYIHEDLSYILKDSAVPIMDEVKGISLNSFKLYALEYLKKRKIPEDKIKQFFFGVKNYINPDTKEKLYIAKKIIIPFYFNDTVYAFQARDLKPDASIKYLTVMGKNECKIFNYFNVDLSEEVIILEGPINSFFVRNSVAVCGTISPNNIPFKILKKNCEKRIWAFDNDKAGKERTVKFFQAGETCFIWPKEWREFGDINDVIKKKSLTSSEMFDIIKHNSAPGILGLVKFKLS